jgi:hypothetical protein
MLTVIDSIKGMNTSSLGAGLSLGVSSQSVSDAGSVDCELQSHVLVTPEGSFTLAEPADKTAGRLVLVTNVGVDRAFTDNAGLVKGLGDVDGDLTSTFSAGMTQMFVWTGSFWSCMSTTLAA